jgi:hypothetical protein
VSDTNLFVIRDLMSNKQEIQVQKQEIGFRSSNLSPFLNGQGDPSFDCNRFHTAAGHLVGSLGSHALGHGVNAGQGLVMEVMLTFILVFTIFGVAVDRRGPGVIAPLPIGFAVLVDHLVGVPNTGPCPLYM